MIDFISDDCFYVMDLEPGEKIPKCFCSRIISAEESMNIESMSFTAIFDHESNGQGYIRIPGELFSKRLKDDIMLYVMVYNKDGTLIGCSFSTVVRQKSCRGRVSFKTGVYLPINETVSKIVIHPGYNPAVTF